MKRGCEPVPIIFNIPNSLKNSDLPEKIPHLSALKTFIPSEFSVFLLPFTAILEELKQLIPKESLYLFCRKLQFQIAEHFCKKFDMKGIVIGDLLDSPEKSKIYSLVDTNLKLPIYRPLISLDAERLTRYKNLLGISDGIFCPNFCTDTGSKVFTNQFSDTISFDEMVTRSIERVKQKTI